MTQLKPWREVVQPRDDVKTGKTVQAEFAVDLSRVVANKGPRQYLDPVYFFQQTYITEGMKNLLVNVAQRLNTKGGEPIIQLQTGFGGGKTHSMLAVYHMVKFRETGRGEVPINDLSGMGEILNLANVPTIPAGRVVVLDGNSLAPAQPRMEGNIALNTLWGRLAWGLGGEEAYEMVRPSDEAHTSPGKDILTDLISKYSPCVILIDELVAYYRQLPDDNSIAGGSLGANLSFIQALTEAVKSVPRAVVLASLPESEAEAGDIRGQRALERLGKIFDRVQKGWKPVGPEESFEIVRKRLFGEVIDKRSRDIVCEAFMDEYRKNSGSFPLNANKELYLDRLKRAYPIHPEIFDELYNFWTPLEKFQRTRGVLKLMSNVIHKLWADDNKDLMIMPGSLPLFDSNTQMSFTDPLPTGWPAVIDTDIDGDKSIARALDTHGYLGSISAASRISRALFLATAPDQKSRSNRGVEKKTLLLGVVEPGQSIGHYEDALHKLTEKDQYLFTERDRYWFGITSNLNKEKASREERFRNQPEKLRDEIRDILTAELRSSFFEGRHIFPTSADLPDDQLLRIVVLPPDQSYARGEERAESAAKELLFQHGKLLRTNRNRLIFLVCDVNWTSSLRDSISSYLAWKSIKEDVANSRLNLDVNSARDVDSKVDSAKKDMRITVISSYSYIFSPSIPEQDPQEQNLEWEHLKIGAEKEDFAKSMEILFQKEYVVDKWNPRDLLNKLNSMSLLEEDVSVSHIWAILCENLTLYRLLNKDVLIETIRNGVVEGLFGLAERKVDGKYENVYFREEVALIPESAIIIPDKIAAEFKKLVIPDPSKPPVVPITPSGNEDNTGDGTGGDRPPKIASKLLLNNINLDEGTPRQDLEEFIYVIKQIHSKSGLRVKYTLGIEIDKGDGFTETDLKSLKENLLTQGLLDKCEIEEQ